MKRFANLKFVALFALLAAVPFVAGAYTERTYAQEQTNQPQQEQAKEEAETEAAFTYTAQPGDSYSLIARKAIQTYGIINKVDLSEAQIIYAETLLTQEAGSPELAEGQKVSIKESTVKSWVEKAQKLSESAEAAWNVYAQDADFNTDHVGEPTS